MSAPSPGRAWLAAGIWLSAGLLLTLGVYHETVLYLTGLWNQVKIGEYAHGYLVLAISGYLVLRNRKALSDLTPCPQYRALIAVLILSLLWMVAALVDVEMAQAAGLLLLILAMVWAVLGNRVSSELAFAILFIGFAIPVWSPLSSVLQDLTTDIVFRMVRIVGIPAYREGTEIVLPAGISSITEACSGLRYLLPALALGALYGHLNNASFRARLLVVLIAAGAAVLVNLLRVFIVVYLGYATDMQHPWVDDHLVLGWYLFGGLVIILLLFDALLQRKRGPADPARAEAKKRPSVGSCQKGTLQYAGVAVASSILASAGPAVTYWVNQWPSEKKEAFELELPPGTGGWTGPVASADDWMPEYRGAVARKQTYQKAGERIHVYIGYYPVQRQGEELINDLNRISNENVWRMRYPRGRVRQAADGRLLEQLLQNAGGQQRLVWYWYRVAGRRTANEYEAKWLQVSGLLTGKPQAYVIAIATDLRDGSDRARTVFGDFLSTMAAPLAQLEGGSAQGYLPDHE